MKLAVSFFAEEAQDVLGAEAQQGMFDQLAVQRGQGLAVLKQDVGSEFGLVHSPVVLVSLEHGAKQGVDRAGQPFQQCRPVQTAELLGKALSLGGLSDAGEGVVQLQEAQPMQFHLSGEPFMAIDGNLDDEGKPGLQAHMDQAELGVEEVVVQAKAFPISGLNAGGGHRPL